MNFLIILTFHYVTIRVHCEPTYSYMPAIQLYIIIIIIIIITRHVSAFLLFGVQLCCICVFL